MGTITAQSIIDDAWGLANDTGTRWPAAECLKTINDGQREIVTYLPSANTARSVLSTVAGSRQSAAGMNIPELIQFLDVPRNMSSDGLSTGDAITLLPEGRKWLDAARPGWHAETSNVVKHYFTDERDPKAFYIWPAANGVLKLEVIYSAAPSDIASTAGVMNLDDIYKTPLMYYLLFRMKMKNKPGASSSQDAQQWYSLFLQILGAKDIRVRRNDQNQKGEV